MYNIVTIFYFAARKSGKSWNLQLIMIIISAKTSYFTLIAVKKPASPVALLYCCISTIVSRTKHDKFFYMYRFSVFDGTKWCYFSFNICKMFSSRCIKMFLNDDFKHGYCVY